MPLLKSSSTVPDAASPNWLQRLSALDRDSACGWVQAWRYCGAAVAAVVMGRQPDYRCCFSNLGDRDGGAVVAQLSQMNVPKYSEGGGAILIPAERVHDVRLRLATQGLPGPVAGFETDGVHKFGMTQFQERLNFQRGLEGSSPGPSSRCLRCRALAPGLAQNGFSRGSKALGPVLQVSLHPGRILDRAQLAASCILVASSVPELAPSAVSVLDDTGKLLSQSPRR